MNAPTAPSQFDAGKQYASKLEYALDAARRGIPVFRLLPDSKKPAFQGWQYEATTNEARIHEMFADKNWNIGGKLDGYAVPDADKRNGGLETLKELVDAEGLDRPEHHTLVSKTHSGGFHMIFRLPEGERLKSRAHTFGRGIDLKTGAGAYIVLPGSVINGNKYEWYRDRPIAKMPKGLIERAKAFGRPSEKSAAAGKRLVAEDDEVVERAERWLKDHAPHGEQGSRDNTAYNVACKLYDFGVANGTAHALLSSWNYERCKPPLEHDEIDRIADSASRNRQNPIGVRGATASGFEPTKIFEPEETGGKPEDRKFDWITAAESAARATSQPQDWLVEDIMHDGGEATLIGKPGEGKSFLVLALLYHIAKGLAFAGRAVKQGLAIYVAAEAQGGVHKRMGALKIRYGDLDDAPFAIIAHAPDLAHGLDDAKLLLKVIREIEGHFGQRAAIIGIDTLNRVMAGGDENGPKDMGAVLNAVRYIRAETGAASLIVHHPGWTGEHGRGHSSQFGAVDTDIFVANRIMTVKKLRDGESGKEIAFRLEPTTVGFTDTGKRITSCYVEVGSREEIQTPPTNGQAEVLRVAEAVAAEGRPITVKNIQAMIEKWRKSGTSTFSGSSEKHAIRMMLKEVEDKNLVKKTKREEWVIVKVEEVEESRGSEGCQSGVRSIS